MSMIRHQGPGIEPRFHLYCKITQSLDKVLTVFVVIDDPTLFNPSEDNMVKGSGSIESRLAEHKTSFRASDSAITTCIPYLFNLVNNVPLVPTEHFIGGSILMSKGGSLQK